MQSRVFIAGHNGMVGSAILRKLLNNSDVKVLTASKYNLDLTDPSAVLTFMKDQKPDIVYLAAARVGGIFANDKYPAEFIRENLLIQCNVIHSAHKAGVEKLLFLGSSCIYPKNSDQPIKEEYLLSGKLEQTNEPYAVAKIAGIKLCESYNRQYGVDYRCIMPTNLYGKNDNFHPENSHVIPGLMQRFHEAKIEGRSTVEVWGSGEAKREFLYVDDLADACIHIMKLTKDEIANVISDQMCSHINVGTGKDITIENLASTMAKVIGFRGQIVFDKSKPDGTPRKLLDVHLINSLGWKYSTNLERGLLSSYKWYLNNLLVD